MRTLALLALAALSASAVGAQEAPARPEPGTEPPAEAAQPAPAPIPLPLPTEDLEGDDQDAGPSTYDPEGRRDPFRPLTGEAADTELRKAHEGTLKGRLLNEVRLTSIVRTPRGNIATFEGGPKREGYFARVGDEFWDGTVQEVNFDTMTVVVRQKLDDPRLIKDYRDTVIQLFTEEERLREMGSPIPQP